MKKTFYFPHDYHSRHDPKLEKLFLTLGYEGLGIYWCVVEMLYEQGGYLKLSDLILHAKSNLTLCERIASVVNDYGLFLHDKDRFWSKSCLDRLSTMESKSRKASESAYKRWGGNANAMPMHSEGNAIKKERKKVYVDLPTVEDVKKYCAERGNVVNPQRFVDFYSSKGWMIGKNKMKDWRAAVRTWESKDVKEKEWNTL